MEISYEYDDRAITVTAHYTPPERATAWYPGADEELDILDIKDGITGASILGDFDDRELRTLTNELLALLEEGISAGYSLEDLETESEWLLV